MFRSVLSTSPPYFYFCCAVFGQMVSVNKGRIHGHFWNDIVLTSRPTVPVLTCTEANFAGRERLCRAIVEGARNRLHSTPLILQANHPKETSFNARLLKMY